MLIQLKKIIMARRPLQEINAGSMADIAFLLLIFFLVTTTMDKDMGLLRKLPPPKPPDQEIPEFKKRNLFVVLINKNNQLAVRGKLSNVSSLCKKTKEFIENPMDKPNMSEHKAIVSPYFENATVSKGIISLQNDRGTSYEMYIKVQNELVKAFNELRDEKARQKFGKPFDALSEAKQKAIQDLYPMAISESEPAAF